MVIGGAAGIILGVIAVLGVSDLAAAIGEAASFSLLMLAAILVWASGVAGLIAGIVGIKNAVDPEKVLACIVFGSLTMAFSALGNFLSVTGGSGFNAGSLIIGLLLPVLYLIGAFWKKNAS